MAEDQAVSADSRIVANHDRLRRIDERHLLDLAIAADYKPGLWGLEPTHKYLLVDLGILADFDVGCVRKVIEPIWTCDPKQMSFPRMIVRKPIDV